MSAGAFLSYSYRDDEANKGLITYIGERLELSVGAYLGLAFKVFNGRHINWGELWEKKIEREAARAYFLIPFLSPWFFRSEACRRELSFFLRKARALDAPEIILPVRFIKCSYVDLSGDPLAIEMEKRQVDDWTNLRHLHPRSRTTTNKIEQMSLKIAGLAVQAVGS